MKLLWLASVLRNAGLKVVEEPDWESRGGEMGNIEGVLLHHTAGPKKGNMPSLQLVRQGRPDLKGPLAHLALGRDGTFYVVSAGKSNHAGPGSWRHITSGNTHLIGIEAENTGVGEPWPAVQMDAYVRGVAAILEYLHLPYIRAIAHKEWAPKRKIDPSFDMDKFREKVKEIMARKKKVVTKEEEFVKKSIPIEDDVFDLTEADIALDYVQNVKLPPPPEEVEAIGSVPPPTFDYSLYRETEPETEAVESDANRLKGFAMTGASNRGLFAKDLLEKLGWKDYQAAAIVGNLMEESGEQLNTDAKGDLRKGVYTAYGIGQWRGARLEHLKRFATDYGKNNNIKNPVADLEVQVRFVDWELRNTEKLAGRMVRESNDIMEALRGAISYERPAGWSLSHPEHGMAWKDRLAHAYKLLRR